MDDVKVEMVEIKVEETDSKYACPLCGKQFMYTFNLGRHMTEQKCSMVKLEPTSDTSSIITDGTTVGNPINLDSSTDGEKIQFI